MIKNIEYIGMGASQAAGREIYVLTRFSLFSMFYLFVFFSFLLELTFTVVELM